MSDTMSPAEVSALRHMMGLSMDALARLLGVNPRTVRSWESAASMPSESSTAAVWALAWEHDELVRESRGGRADRHRA